ncbi:type II toxin-antitoxin system Phd/YefM family antitoxin [Modestobacter roseus]|uniref:Antitoxin n=1 Tax=Modestobacter roseus TaxID=1181884 RepID=A0A562IW84_9ACTN|nr:type II toxin-antitoxin system prevent-host-death family antitoxin [Modestobacter roseus]MQA34761.1 type II toxin-antitoxin system prevent-host-death family antitoxin [Modestobacter roseus]TWH75073.1 prevent-host-death family protein [Modestobacter roseus]
MTTVGLRELRQQASDLIRRVEAGEEVTVTVAGRPSVRLVPAQARSWRSWAEIDELFTGPADPTWERDRDLVDPDLVDPWAPR